jgi:fido (protein-threonine AMPylation protein)
MSEKDGGDRSSEAASALLITDPNEIARREAENGLRQFDSVVGLVERYLADHWVFKLRLSIILSLHRDALIGIHPLAGNFRPSTVEIKGSSHTPPDAWQVPELVEEMCDYINENWETATPLHLAAYAMWRMNWIHPFADGNGRTARAVSYLILCMKMRSRIPGRRTIPDLISDNKNPYYDALEAADRHWADRHVFDLAELEHLLGDLLAAQLVSALEQASGKPIDASRRG